MYKLEKIGIRDLFEQNLTNEKSKRALRARGKEGILVPAGLGDDGRTQFFDKQLSIARVKAARKCKVDNTSVTWGTFKRTLGALDSKNPSLNNIIIDLLNNNHPEGEVRQKVIGFIIDYLRENRYIN